MKFYARRLIKKWCQNTFCSGNIDVDVGYVVYFHWHIMPRFKNDILIGRWISVQFSEEGFFFTIYYRLSTDIGVHTRGLETFKGLLVDTLASIKAIYQIFSNVRGVFKWHLKWYDLFWGKYCRDESLLTLAYILILRVIRLSSHWYLFQEPRCYIYSTTLEKTREIRLYHWQYMYAFEFFCQWSTVHLRFSLLSSVLNYKNYPW